MEHKYKLYGGLFNNHNEIYDVIDKMRGKTDKKFDYVCSDNAIDSNYLDLTCIEGKILKYIFKMDIKNNKTENKPIDKEELNKKYLITYLNKLNDKYTEIKNKISSSGGFTIKGNITTLSTKTTGQKILFIPKLILEIVVWILILAFGAVIGIIVGIFCFLMTCKESKRGGGNEKEEIIEKKMNELNSKIDKLIKKISPKHRPVVVKIFSDIQIINTNIINKLEKINDKISIKNICINGQGIPRKHNKCKSNDYKSENADIDLKSIKLIFKNVDVNIDMNDNVDVEKIKDTNKEESNEIVVDNDTEDNLNN